MPKSNTPKLNATQLVILSSASQREDGLAVLPHGVRAASVKAAVIRLTKLGLLKQIRVKRDQPHWSSDEEGKRTGLKITNAGSRAIGVSDDHKGEEENGACLLGVSFSDWTVGSIDVSDTVAALKAPPSLKNPAGSSAMTGSRQ